MRSLFLTTFFIFIFFPLSIVAQPVALEVSVDQNKISLDDQIVLTARVRGGIPSAEPQFLSKGNFQIVSRGFSRREISVNGEQSLVTEYVYILSPLQEGTHILGPLSVRVEGVEYKSDPLRISVTPSPKRTLPKNPGYQTQNPFLQPSAPPSSPLPTGEHPEVFVVSEVSNLKPFRGEQIFYTFRLYTRRSFRSANLELPDFQGFQSEQIERQRKYYQDLGGKRYVVSEVKMALFPIQAGKIEIPPTQLKGEVEEPLNLPFSFQDPSFALRGGPTEFRSRSFKTDAYTLEVKELPIPAPADFKGLVGNYTLRSELSKKELKPGENGEWKVTIAGSGSIQEARLELALDLPELKIYPEKPTTDVKKSASGISGTKTFKWSLVPQSPGKFQIPALTLSFFNPKKGIYETLSTSPYELTVLGAGQDRVVSSSPFPSSASPASPSLQDPLAPLQKTLTQVSFADRGFFYAIGIIFIIPLAAFGIVYALASRRRWRSSHPDLVKRQKALFHALKQLQDSPPSLEEIGRIIKSYLGDKIGKTGAALTAQEIKSSVIQEKIPQQAARELSEFLEKLDRAKYSGVTLENASLEALRSEAIGLLRKNDFLF